MAKAQLQNTLKRCKIISMHCTDFLWTAYPQCAKTEKTKALLGILFWSNKIKARFVCGRPTPMCKNTSNEGIAWHSFLEEQAKGKLKAN